MSFRTRMILYALIPLLLITGAMLFISLHQTDELSSKELQIFRDRLVEARKREVINYVRLVQAAIHPIIHDSDEDEKSALERVIKIFNKMKYDNDDAGNYDGYFFLYDQKCINLYHPFPEIVGTYRCDEKGREGNYITYLLLEIANKGGGFHSYLWKKPSTGKEQDKTSYVVKLDRWEWVLGTGFYLDDVTKEIIRIENQVISNIRQSFTIVLALTILSTVLLGSMVNWHENRLANARLRESAHKFVLLQVKERRRFARELHDGINQLLVAAKHRIELVAYRQKKNMPYSMDHLDQATVALNESIREVRHISHDLRPGLLDDMGLQAALEHLLNQFMERTRIHCEFIYQVEGNIQEEIEITLYRIVQESLTNIEKHAQAQHVSLSLESKIHSVILDVYDDGIGFSLAMASKTSCIGLINMRERVELLGGDFKLLTSQNKGTRIIVELEKNS